MFRDPGTTGPHRLKKRKDRSALVPALALLAGQRASFPNASWLACRNSATTPGQRTGWIMRRDAIPPAAISFSRPGVGSSGCGPHVPWPSGFWFSLLVGTGFSRRVVLFCLESTNGPSGPPLAISAGPFRPFLRGGSGGPGDGLPGPSGGPSGGPPEVLRWVLGGLSGPPQNPG